MKKMIIVLVCVASLGGAVAVMACGAGGHGMGHAHGFNEGMKHIVLEQVVGLSEEQKAKVNEIRAGLKQKMREQHIQQNVGRLYELDPDAPDFQERVQKMAKLKSEKVEAHILARAEVHAQIYQLLTSEQKQKLNDFREKMHNQMAKHHFDKVTGRGTF